MIRLARYFHKRISETYFNKREEPVLDILGYQLGRLQGK